MSSVLVADDSAVMRKAIRARLEAGGVDTVIEAEDGFETIAKVLTEKPNVVVLDIVMTRLNGLETLKELRKLRPQLPVIVHTHYAEALKYQGLFRARKERIYSLRCRKKLLSMQAVRL